VQNRAMQRTAAQLPGMRHLAEPPCHAAPLRCLCACVQTVGLLPTHCPPAMDSPTLQAAFAQSVFAYIEVGNWAEPGAAVWCDCSGVGRACVSLH